jgi:hypothetical protein
MQRAAIYSLIDNERTYQDRTYNPDEVLTSGSTRRQRDNDVTSHLVLLDLYITKAKEDWNVKGDNRPALKQIAKIAAIAVRALERAGGSEALLEEGLR